MADTETETKPMRHVITLTGGGPETLADLLCGEIGNMTDGKVEYVINDVPFTIYYDEHQAHGDNGLPVPGDVTGEYQLRGGVDGPMGLTFLADIHVAPHGTSGYGSAYSKPYSARQIALVMGHKVYGR